MIPFWCIAQSSASATAENTFGAERRPKGCRVKKSCTRWELFSLIGQLHHASAVVRPGRTFLCHLIDLSTTAGKLHLHICLTNSSYLDIEWWCAFLVMWNGVSFLPPLEPHSIVESDASGSWGELAIWGHQRF